MTYIYAFNAAPDGIGVIADTRLTLVDALGHERASPDQVAKVYPLGLRAFVGIAGTVGHAATILDGLSRVLRSAPESKRYDIFLSHCETRLERFRAGPAGSVEQTPEVQLIYGDIRHKRGQTRCRLIRLEPTIVQGSLKMRRTTASEGLYVAIGWTPEGRRELNTVASEALSETEGRGLEITELRAQDIQELGQHSPNARGFKADSSGPRTGKLRSQLRKYAAHTFSINSNVLAVEPVLLYCGIAQAAIAAKAEQLRSTKAEGIETIGDQWTAASLTLRHSFRIFNNDELVALTPIIKALC